jgi:hypothetical protein
LKRQKMRGLRKTKLHADGKFSKKRESFVLIGE